MDCSRKAYLLEPVQRCSCEPSGRKIGSKKGSSVKGPFGVQNRRASTLRVRMEGQLDHRQLSWAEADDGSWFDLNQVPYDDDSVFEIDSLRSFSPTDLDGDSRGTAMGAVPHVPSNIPERDNSSVNVGIESDQSWAVYRLAIFVDEREKPERVSNIVSDFSSFLEVTQVGDSAQIFQACHGDLVALYIDDRQKSERIQKFVSEFNSSFETEDGRRQLASIDPVLLGVTRGEAAARFLAKYERQSTF